MDRQLQKSLNAKRSVVIGQHETGVSLEAAFWKGLVGHFLVQEDAAVQTRPWLQTIGIS